MDTQDGLIFAFTFAEDRATPIDWSGVEKWSPEHGPLWVHLDRTSERVRDWIEHKADIPEIAAEAMLAGKSRPRINKVDSGVVLTLRGVNLNPHADPSDMISLRIWLDEHRMITVRRERVMAVDDVRQESESPHPPHNHIQALVRLTERLIERMGPTIDDVVDRLDDLEQLAIDPEKNVTRRELAPLRLSVISLHRYLAPQREAMQQLLKLETKLFDDADRAELQETLNRLTHYVEELHSGAARALVIQDEISSQLSEQTNTRMYAITIIAGIFLPLSLIAGLFGINVGGMPWIENPWGFWIVCGIIAILGVASWLYVRRLRWL